MRLTLGQSLPLLGALLGACGGGGNGGNGGDAGSGPGPTTLNLVSRSWSQAANSESYQCREIQATADLLLTAFHPALPPGQFRMWLVTSDAPTNATPGDFACALDTVYLAGNRLIYAAGMGTGDTQFPGGVGVRIRSGQYVTLILHLVNPQSSPLGGTSGVTVQTASQVTSEADMIFAGTTAISIPASGSGTAVGGCTASRDFSLFALLPMANRLGTHHTVTLTHSASSTLHDASYDFNSQVFHGTSATVLTGDNLQVTCSYLNTSLAVVHFGPNSSDELCLTGLYRFPAPALPENPFACVSH